MFISYLLFLSMNLAAKNFPSFLDLTKNTLLKPPMAKQQHILYLSNNFYLERVRQMSCKLCYRFPEPN